jgi:hypothetical protein
VADLMRARGWIVEPFGQALLTETIRAVIRRKDNLPLRWIPDLLCTRDQKDPPIVLIDAKTGRSDTPFYDLERNAYDAAMRWLYSMRADDFWYVWHDFHRSSVMQISQGLARGEIVPGPYFGNGSGTPYLLIPKRSTYWVGAALDAAP